MPLSTLRHQYSRVANQLAIQRHNRFVVRENAHGIAILDDYFPNLLTGFRVAEYNRYLELMPGAMVYSCDPSFSTDIRDYASRFPHLAPRVRYWDTRWNRISYLPARLAYCLFLNNAYRFLPLIEQHRLPFVFTLYPGGGFGLENAASDRKLERVCASPSLQKIIVTQTVTRDYLLRRQFCSPEQVVFIYGGVFPSDFYRDGPDSDRRHYPETKPTFDLCFVAHRYTPTGADKGYDIFVAVARLLAGEIPRARFHVVGDFGPETIPLAGVTDRFRFYGPVHREALREFYAGMDLILSPNAPFQLYEGGFDGFPTGCCIEAGMSGVAVFCTDPLSSNFAFEDGKELVILPREPAAIAALIARYHDVPEQLYALGANGRQAFLKRFDIDEQMAARVKVLAESSGIE